MAADRRRRHPNTHRATIRSEIDDGKDELRPGMLANFLIRVGGPAFGIAVPANAVVRGHAAQTEFLDLDDAGVTADIDDPDAYRNLRGARV